MAAEISIGSTVTVYRDPQAIALYDTICKMRAGRLLLYARLGWEHLPEKDRAIWLSIWESNYEQETRYAQPVRSSAPGRVFHGQRPPLEAPECRLGLLQPPADVRWWRARFQAAAYAGP